MDRSSSLKPAFWYVAAWTTLAVLWALQVAPDAQGPIQWRHAFALSAINFYSSALVAIPIVVFAWKRGFNIGNLFQSTLFYAVAITLASVCRFIIFIPLLALVTGTQYGLFDELRVAFVPQFLGLGTVLAVVLAIRSVQLTNELTAARLAALQSQLQPHFLFNTLNAVSTLMHRDVAEADEMLAGLCDLLRHTLQTWQRVAIPLGEELTILTHYIEIMNRRFPGKLDVKLDVPSDLRELPVPPFMLQPLVENVLQHGLNQSGDVTRIRLHAERSHGSVVVNISDNGPGVANGAERTRAGIGLENTRRRLEAFYGSRAHLALRDRTNGGTEVLLTLPDRGRL